MNVACTNLEPKSKAVQVRVRRPSRRLRVGFVPVNDCAPYVVAAEYNLFRKYGLEVELCREKGWNEVRDKIIFGELDAAHAPGTLPFLATLGIDGPPCACTTGLVTSLQGNAITLSRQLWDRGIRDALSLRQQIKRDRSKRTYSFGVGFSHSSQYFLLRQWLAAGELLPGSDVNIVVIPPAEMPSTLKLGYLDGYCIGEPWTTTAVVSGVGVCVASSTMLAPRHPEKVLMVTERFARERPAEHERLAAALLEACALCDQPENCETLARLLARPEYVNGPAEQDERPLFGSQIFYRYRANEPTEDQAAWICSHLRQTLADRQSASAQRLAPLLQQVFQRRTFLAARRMALRALKRVEVGDLSLRSLERRSLWPRLSDWLRAFSLRNQACHSTASSSEARTGARAPHRSSAPCLGEREPVFCSPKTAVAGTE